ncbi:glycosyltransferase family 4 protein [Candidatus Pseudothioglobus singularis]|nr:glycosyltransferase family 4 protein [Candidatus Pseudothioglobus singularis]
MYFESHKFSKFLLKPLSKLDGVIVINNYLFKSYKKHGLKKVFVAHDGVNIDDYSSISQYKFQPKKNKFNLVYTGSLFQWKGVYTLIDSLNFLANNVNLICIGGSSQYLEDFKSYVKESGQEDRVTIVPHIPKKELLVFIEIADILVLPNSAKDKMSLYTSPIKMFEYMASKRPIVASNLSSIKEVLTHKKNAFLFSADNEKDLACKINLVLSQDSNHLVTNAYQEVNKYAWDDRAENIKEFIELSEGV